MKLGIRKLQENPKAGSFFLILPKAWVDGLKLEKSAPFEIEAIDKKLIIKPLGVKD